MSNFQKWNTYEHWNSYNQHDLYEQWRNEENFSYFTNCDHFGIQAEINQLKFEKKLAQPPVFYQVPPPPLGFYQVPPPPLGFYRVPPPPGFYRVPPPGINFERNILSDLNIKADPWTPEGSPRNEKSFFNFKDCEDILLE